MLNQLSIEKEDKVFKLDYTHSTDGYLILNHQGASLLLDTGCPESFGLGLVGVPGVTSTPAHDVHGLTPEWLSEKMDHHIDGVIGAEVLRTNTLSIDPVQQCVTLSESPMIAGEGVPVQDELNVPVIDVGFDGKVVPTIFDTGAPLGYVPKAMTQCVQPTGSMQDFYPLFGYFRTDVFEIPVRIGACQEVIAFGVFPEQIEQIHRNSGFPTIIGLGLLKNHCISLSLRESYLKLTPLHKAERGTS